MKKILLILLLGSPSIASGSSMTRMAQYLGFTISSPGNGVSTQQLSTTATWVCNGILPAKNETLSTVSMFFSALSGTVVSTDAVVSLVGDGGASTGTFFESQNLGASVVVSTWNVWSGFSTQLVGGTFYNLCVKNLDTNPAVNNFTTRNITSTLIPLSGSLATGKSEWGNSITGNSGVTFSSARVGQSMRVGYADGTYDGMPSSNNGTGSDGNHERVYGSTETGVVFTTPANSSINLSGIGFFLVAVGTAQTGPLVAHLFIGASTTAVVTSNAISTQTVVNGSGNWFNFYFSQNFVLLPNTTYRITFAEPGNSDTVANCFLTDNFTWDPNPNSHAMLPFEGSAHETSLTTSVWVDNTNTIIPFALILDGSGEFAGGSISTTSGSGTITIK